MTSAIIMLTDSCNLHCPHCYKKPEDTVCDIEKIKKFITDYNIKVIKIFGGEPLLSKNLNVLKELLDYCDANSILYYTTSNLTFELTEDLEKIIRKFLFLGTSFNYRRWSNDSQYNLWLDNCKKISNYKPLSCAYTLDKDLLSKSPEEVHTLINTFPFKENIFEAYIGVIKPKNEEVDNWLCEFYKLNKTDEHLNEIYKIIIGQMIGKKYTVKFSNTCFLTSYTFHTDGHITCCPISTVDISKDTIKGREYLKELYKLDDTCLNCKWLNICNGVCPLLKHDKDYCRGYPKLYEIIKKDLDEGLWNNIEL